MTNLFVKACAKPSSLSKSVQAPGHTQVNLPLNPNYYWVVISSDRKLVRPLAIVSNAPQRRNDVAEHTASYLLPNDAIIYSFPVSTGRSIKAYRYIHPVGLIDAGVLYEDDIRLVADYILRNGIDVDTLGGAGATAEHDRHQRRRTIGERFDGSRNNKFTPVMLTPKTRSDKFINDELLPHLKIEARDSRQLVLTDCNSPEVTSQVINVPHESEIIVRDQTAYIGDIAHVRDAAFMLNYADIPDCSTCAVIAVPLYYKLPPAPPEHSDAVIQRGAAVELNKDNLLSWFPQMEVEAPEGYVLAAVTTVFITYDLSASAFGYQHRTNGKEVKGRSYVIWADFNNPYIQTQICHLDNFNSDASADMAIVSGETVDLGLYFRDYAAVEELVDLIGANDTALCERIRADMVKGVDPTVLVDNIVREHYVQDVLTVYQLWNVHSTNVLTQALSSAPAA